jgi:hypothetical protein
MGIGMGLQLTFIVAIRPASAGTSAASAPARDVHAHARDVGRGRDLGRDHQLRVDRRLPGRAASSTGCSTRPGATASALTCSDRLAGAVGLAAHEAFIAALAIAVLTLAATLCLPARLSPTRTPV